MNLRNRYCVRRLPALLFVLFCYTHACSQVSSEAIRTMLANPPAKITASGYLESATKFYAGNGYQFRWIRDSLAELSQLLTVFLSLPQAGLLPEDYVGSLPVQLLDAGDSVHAEIGLTITALGIIHDLAYGRQNGFVSYDGIRNRVIDSSSSILNRLLQTGTLDHLPGMLEPSFPGYINMRNCLIRLEDMVIRPDFTNENVKKPVSRADSNLIRKRICQYGLTDDELPESKRLSEKEVKKAQTLFGIYPDGKLTPSLLNALNVSLEQRIRDIASAMNVMRWVFAQFGDGPGIIVNIPSAGLGYFEQKGLALYSRIIAGKPSTPTPTLSSLIDEVVLYPYWYVPFSIATRELLPMIKKDPGYINAGNYQLLNSKGKIVDPYTVNWPSIHAKNFPFVLRQSTGCDNALGWIKLNFYNPYSVYLHDTPAKLLFQSPKRFFSHGCMRVEKASDLARKVLAGNTVLIDSLEKLGPLKNLSPYTIRIPSPVPVIVLYQLAWFDADGNICFPDDVYRKRVKESFLP